MQKNNHLCHQKGGYLSYLSMKKNYFRLYIGSIEKQLKITVFFNLRTIKSVSKIDFQTFFFGFHPDQHVKKPSCTKFYIDI